MKLKVISFLESTLRLVLRRSNMFVNLKKGRLNFKRLLFCSLIIIFALFIIARNAFPKRKNRIKPTTKPTATVHVWPIPKQMTLSGPSVSLSRAFSINTWSKSAILRRGITRYLEYFASGFSVDQYHDIHNDAEVNTVVVRVANDDETLGMDTSYKYEIVLKAIKTVYIDADNPFGAL